MKHSISFAPHHPDEFAEWCRLSEEMGFDTIWIPDSQSLFRELFVSCAVCAANTRAARFGPGVLIPRTRHPAVTASAAATLAELSGGRAILGLGTGDSAILNLGLRPAKVDEMRSYVGALRGLLEAGRARYQENDCALTWNRERVPIYLAAEGPRMLRLAGEIADGVIVGSGLLPEVVADSLSLIEEGAKRSGRTLDDLDLWWIIKVNVQEDGERAREEIRANLAASAQHAFRFTLEGKRVPDGLRSAIERLKREYEPSEHEKTEVTTRNATLVDELGLREYLLERFALAGTPEECRARLAHLERIGVRNIRVNANVPDKPELIRLWGTRVMRAGDLKS